MLRLTLVAYLTFTVVLGPGLCCCSAQLLFPGAGGAGCCGSHHHEALAHDHHAHQHHHDGDVQLEHSQTAEQENHSKSAPCDHNQQDCPCGRHQQTLLASQSCDGATINALNSNHLVDWTLPGDFLSLNSAGQDLHFQLCKGHARPGELSGREILRAHSVLRI